MNAGYIYILQNQAFGAHVVKIGRTAREPSVRAREIYAGATGVPMPFDLATAYSVSDCVLAEKRIHRRLAAYRMNRLREFFRLSPSVAASTAYEVCAEVNRDSGASSPRPYVFPTLAPQSVGADQVTALDPTETAERIVYIDPSRLRDSPIGTSEVTSEQSERARTVARILARVYPLAHGTWIEDFSRDRFPEQEIQIWEHIAKAYLSIEQVEVAQGDVQREAFELLLARSMSSSQQVLRDAHLRNFTRQRAKRLLEAYELKPRPVAVAYRRTQA